MRACFAVQDRARIRVAGADRIRFLNGQSSNDLRKLTPASTLWTLILTVKGKLCAIALAWQEADAIILETESENAPALLERLERYAISDDVAFELIENPPVTWHLLEPVNGGRQSDRIGIPGSDLPDQPPDIPILEADEIERLRIAHGRPRWGADLSPDTLPQEARLDDLAVDFHKGCYVGQEIVSRLASVGHVNRTLCGFQGRGLAPGASLTGSQGVVGRLTSAISTSDGHEMLALGYLSTRASDELFSVLDESGACLGTAERRQFPLVSA